MREFKIVDRIQDAEFNFIEKKNKISIPILFKDYLKKYGGMAIYESQFSSRKNGSFQIGQFLMFDEILNLSKEFEQSFDRKLIPFAYDPGGWHFCLSFDESTFGNIIVNRWTDHSPEEQFVVIADSFEEFVNGLKRSDELS